MQSTAEDVTSYLQEVPADRHEALVRLRALCREHLTGFEESMVYGGPSYARAGVVEVGFASQKNYIGLYILRTDVMGKYRALIKTRGVTIGKGVIRYPKPEKINFDLVREMLISTREAQGPVC